MKKITLLMAAIIVCMSAFAQDRKPVRAIDKRAFIDAPYLAPKMVSAQNQPTRHVMSNGNAKSISSINSILIGSAVNILTVYQPENNLVAADDGLGRVVFIHRNNPSIFPLTGSQYRYDISNDKGATFAANAINVGPLNPTVGDEQVPGIDGRYPQVVFYNPSGLPVPDSLYGVYFGTYHNGNTTNDTWDGSITGVFRTDGNTTTMTELGTLQNNGDVEIAASLCNGLPGEFWAVDWAYCGTPGLGDSVILVFKGVWTPTHDVSWSIAHRLNPGLNVFGDTTYKINPLIAFDQTGMKGWIAFAGDVAGNSNATYEPVFYKSTDGGATWTGPIRYDLSADAGIMATMDASGSGVPTTAFENDLVVDMNGDPHYANVVSSGTAHSIETAFRKTLFDFTYSNSSSTWSAVAVDTMKTFRGTLATDGASANYITDNRPQLSVSPARDKVFYFWSDTDPLYDSGNNTYPDLIGKGHSVVTNLWSPTVNFSYNDNLWGLPLGSKPCAWPCTAPTSLRNAANDATMVPVVLTSLNASGIAIDPCDFYYLNNIQFDDAVFVSVPETPGVENIVRVFPNPAKDEITLSYSGLENKNATVTIVDILGKTVKDLGNNFSGFAHYSIRGLDAGIYFINIKTDSGVINQRFEIAK